MTENATEEMMAMARRVAKGLGTDLPFHLREWAEKAALAAIIETQRRDAEAAENCADQHEDTAIGRARNDAARSVATAIRSGTQYGKE